MRFINTIRKFDCFNLYKKLKKKMNMETYQKVLF